MAGSVDQREAGFTNKAKERSLWWAVRRRNPTLGIVDYRTGASALMLALECPLYMAPIRAAIPVLRELIQRADLTYDIPDRRGERKENYS